MYGLYKRNVQAFGTNTKYHNSLLIGLELDFICDKQKNENKFTCDIDDESIKYVFASKGIQTVYFNSQYSIIQRYGTRSEKFTLDFVFVSFIQRVFLIVKCCGFWQSHFFTETHVLVYGETKMKPLGHLKLQTFGCTCNRGMLFCEE